MRIGHAIGLVALFALAVAAHYLLQSPLSPEMGAFALAAVVQSTYSETMPRAVAGMFDNMSNWNVSTRNCETAAGIGFGLACGQGTADMGAVLGGTLANFVGISVKDDTLMNDTPDEYQQNQNMGVLTEGDVWVQTSVAVAVGDPVHYDATTGVFQIASGSGPIVGARWMRGSAAGLGLVRLTGNIPTP